MIIVNIYYKKKIISHNLNKVILDLVYFATLFCTCFEKKWECCELKSYSKYKIKTWGCKNNTKYVEYKSSNYLKVKYWSVSIYIIYDCAIN